MDVLRPLWMTIADCDFVTPSSGLGPNSLLRTTSVQTALALLTKSANAHLIIDMETALRLDLTSNPALDKRGKQLQLAQCIVVNAGHQGRVSEISVAMMATTVEALMGAVWEDRGGMDGKADALMEVEKVMEKMGFFEHHVFSPVSTSSASSLSAMVTPSSLFGSLTTGKSEGAKVVGVEKAGKRENARKMENAGNKEDAGKQEIAGRKEDVGNQDDAGNQGKMQKEEEGITLAMFTPSYVWGPLRP